MGKHTPTEKRKICTRCHACGCDECFSTGRCRACGCWERKTYDDDPRVATLEEELKALKDSFRVFKQQVHGSIYGY